LRAFSPSGYHRRLISQARFYPWVNTAIQAEIDDAMRWGAVGNTMNPSHPPKALRTDCGLWEPIIDETLRLDPTRDDDEVADVVTERMALRSAAGFLPLFESSAGQFGYATIQGNPFLISNASELVHSAETYAALAPNLLPKIPSTEVGARAVEELAARGVSAIATMGFSVSQGVAMAEAYERGLRRCGPTAIRPRCYFVIIPGVFDDYLKVIVERDSVTIDPNTLRWAGIAVARAVYRTFTDKGYKAELQIGGTREPYHITDLVGEGVHVTHSFDTWARLEADNPRITRSIGGHVPAEHVAELRRKLPDFSLAYDPQSLGPAQFQSFGPCAMFLENCRKGYLATRAEVSKRRRIREEGRCSDTLG
jgi:transaldolase